LLQLERTGEGQRDESIREGSKTKGGEGRGMYTFSGCERLYATMHQTDRKKERASYREKGSMLGVGGNNINGLETHNGQDL